MRLLLVWREEKDKMTTHQKQVFLTQKGLKELQKEYEELTKIKRPKAVKRLATARTMGDLTENTEYSAARQDWAFLEEQIVELEAILNRAVVIDEKKKKSVVSVGSTVVLEADGEQDELTIVGSVEADPMKGKISNESPVGQALLGAKVGEVVKVSTSTVKSSYKILKIK